MWVSLRVIGDEAAQFGDEEAHEAAAREHFGVRVGKRVAVAAQMLAADSLRAGRERQEAQAVLAPVRSHDGREHMPRAIEVRVERRAIQLEQRALELREREPLKQIRELVVRKLLQVGHHRVAALDERWLVGCERAEAERTQQRGQRVVLEQRRRGTCSASVGAGRQRSICKWVRVFPLYKVTRKKDATNKKSLFQ